MRLLKRYGIEIEFLLLLAALLFICCRFFSPPVKMIMRLFSISMKARIFGSSFIVSIQKERKQFILKIRIALSELLLFGKAQVKNLLCINPPLIRLQHVRLSGLKEIEKIYMIALMRESLTCSILGGLRK